MANSREIKVGVSACLLGEQVRYDGGHKRDRYVSEVLGEFFSFVPVCPEVELGLGVPRETLRLVRGKRGIELVAPASSSDHTDRMQRFARRRVAELRRLGLCGYILKEGSPSCGMERVRTYTPAGTPAPSSRGRFAEALLSALPLLPVEEEGRLCDPALRESFVERVFAYHRLRALFDARWTVGQLTAFHVAEELLLMAHVPKAVSDLGRIVGRAKRLGRREVAERYQHGYMSALARRASRARHANVLQHMLGYLGDRIDRGDEKEIVEAIEAFRRGRSPLLLPLTLVRRHVRRHRIEYLAGQSYLEPHPYELELRNRV